MNTDLKISIAWGLGLVAIALAATFARQLGAIDQDAVTRIVMAATGLMVASFGNRMPKAWVSSAAARKVTRVGGWAMAISGLIYAGLWAFAPFDVALWIGCGAIAAGMAVTIVYSLMLRGRTTAA